MCTYVITLDVIRDVIIISNLNLLSNLSWIELLKFVLHPSVSAWYLTNSISLLEEQIHEQINEQIVSLVRAKESKGMTLKQGNILY